MGERRKTSFVTALAPWLPCLALAAGACAGEDAAVSAAGHDRSTPWTTRPVRGRVMGGERVDRIPSWPGPGDLDAKTAARARARWGEHLDDAPAPVLLPPAGWGEGELMVGPRWWAWSATSGADRFSIQASVQAHVYPELAPALRRAKIRDRLRGHPATLSRSEGIWSATWIERGVAFTAELDCGGPTVPACAEGEARLRELVEGLVWVTAREVEP